MRGIGRRGLLALLASSQCSIATAPSWGSSRSVLAIAETRQLCLQMLRGGFTPPQIPGEAVALMTREGLQLRTVNWQSKHHASESPDGVGAAMSDVDGGVAGTDAEEKEDISFSIDTEEERNKEDGVDDENEVQSMQMTPAQNELWLACKNGDEEAIYRLVRTEGADVNMPDTDFGGWTACHYAACSGMFVGGCRKGGGVSVRAWSVHKCVNA